MSIKLVIGDRVSVFEDPLTESRCEGVAKLVRRADFYQFDNSELGAQLERWKVRFNREEKTVERWINPARLLNQDVSGR